MRNPHGPPAGWRRLLALAAPARRRAEALGDLDEEFETCALPERGPRGARRWYRTQVLRSLPHFMRLRWADRRRARASRGGEGTLATLLQDLRYGLRTIRSNWLFSATVVFTLALGIGANTTIYSVIDGLVFNPFPFPRPETLVAVGSEYPRLDRPLTFVEHLSPAEFEDIRDQATTLTDVVAWDMGNRQMATATDALNLLTGFWWGDAFGPLRIQPHLGRGLLPDEIRAGAAVAVISHRLWQTNFGSDPDVLGRVIEINGSPYEIVGVMPAGTLLYGMDLWIPMPVGPEVYDRDRRQFQVIGRIAEGRTMEDVATELEGLARRTELEHGAEFPEYAGFHLVPATWTEANVRQFRTAAMVLLGAVFLVLLLVCANVATLLLSRSNGRRREIAIRTTMGAGRWRLVRQLLTESVVLASIGGLGGIALAWVAVEGVQGVIQRVPFISGNVSLGVRPLAFTAGIAVLAGIIFGLAPALHTLSGDLRGVLSAEGKATTGSLSGGRLQRWFVGAEVALALLLLFGGGLLVNSMMRLNRADPGFDHENVLTMRLTLPWEDYEGDQIALFFETLAQRVRAIPGVEAATVGSQFPPITFSNVQVVLEGQEAAPEGSLPTSYATQVGDAYFEVLGIPVLAGRVPGPTDDSGTPLVAAVNEVFRDRYLRGGDPLGQRIRIGGPESDLVAEIVGVVGATANRGFSEGPQPEVFGSVRQLSGTNNQLFLLVRTAGEPRSLLPQVRQAVAEIDPDQPIYAVATMEEVFAGRTSTQSVAAVSLGIFALFALVLAALGIYAVVAYAVSQRRREIGLRMALGAPYGTVRRMMVRQVMVPVAVGTVVGALGALAAGRALAGLLYGVEGTDLPTLMAVGVLFVSVAALAGYVPARRASLVDPALTLREE